MSVQVPDVTIDIQALSVSDDTKNLRKIKHAIANAIIIAIVDCLRDAIRLAWRIVPESKYGDYPESYESEALLESFVAFIQNQIRDLTAGRRILKPEYIIEQDWEASYAEFVNEMTGVTWSKPSSQSGFIERIDNFIRQNLKAYLDAELSKKQHGLSLLYTVR